MDRRCDLNQLAAATRAPERGRPQQADEEGDEIYHNSTSTEEADEANNFVKASKTDANLKKIKFGQCNYRNSSERD